MPDRKDESVKPGVLPNPDPAVHPTLFRYRETRGYGFAVIAPPVMKDAHNMGEEILHFIHEAVMIYAATVNAAAVNAAEKKRRSRRRQIEETDSLARK